MHNRHSVPFLVSVTGHREFASQQVPLVRQAVKEVLRSLHAAYPHTSIALFSPLAEGADQLVASVALELNDEIPIQLLAVLPWSADVEAICESEHGSRWGCRKLVHQASQVVVMPLPDNVSPEALSASLKLQQDQYDRVARYIARHCQVLVAIWDGSDVDESHTARTIQFHLSGALAPFSKREGELDTVEVAAVCHLAVERADSGQAIPDRIKPCWKWPSIEAESTQRRRPENLPQRVAAFVRFGLLAVNRRINPSVPDSDHVGSIGENALRSRWHAMDEYNRYVSHFSTSKAFQDSLKTNQSYLIPDKVAGDLPRSVRELREAYAVADTMAMQWQKRARLVTSWLFVIAFLAVASLETYAHTVPHSIGLLVCYLALLSGGLALYRWTTAREHQGRWLDQRALAEALRVQTYWRWVGLPDCVADYYLRHFRGELDWIRHAARAFYVKSHSHPPISADAPKMTKATIEAVRSYWIEDQYKYFRRAAPANAESATSFETAARLSYWAAIGFAFATLVVQVATHHMSHTLVLCTFGCLLVSAFLKEFAEVQAFAILAHRYRWMSQLYAIANERLLALLDTKQWDGEHVKHAQRILFEVGREALAENADWVVQHRERPPVLPTG